MLSASSLVARLKLAEISDTNMLSIVPQPDIDEILNQGAASIDLRLGRWFRTLRRSRTHILKVEEANQEVVTKEYFVPFEDEYVLHPRDFVLGVTLEWIRLPPDVGGYVTGKSSLGRRGLIIETAAGLQPGFSGCLALELSNVGEVPIALNPGMRICQIFLHAVDVSLAAKSQFAGRRKPVLGKLVQDPVLAKLRGRPHSP